jgi:hypothetical protein
MELYESSSSTPKERMDGNMYPARCIQVLDLGTHANTHPQAAAGSKKRSLMLVFEFSNTFMKDENGQPDPTKPFVLSKEYTQSLGSKANLCKLLNTWNNTNMSEEDKKAFDIKSLMDKPCLITVSKDEKGDKVYNNINSITALPDAMPIGDRVNDLVYYEISDSAGDPEAHGKVYEWIQKKYIVESEEGKNLGLQVIEIKKDDPEAVPF